MLKTIIIILGIVVAGGFLLYFVGDVLMGLASKENKDDEAIKAKQLKKQKELEARVNALENSKEVKKDPAVATVLFNGAIEEAYDPDEDAVEVVAEVETAPAIEEETVEETPVEPAPVEEKQDDIDDYIAKRRQELMQRLAKMQEESQEETTEEETVNLEEEPAPIVPETQTIETPSAVVKPVDADVERLEAELADAQERLRANEKELRQCKKEFIPLRKVKRTLENDEKKLRRKEALVAKQKVVLYGVNNYADIDEEKAKKLAEDLDLLDGLKLSVQHCHEVMANNEERYPLLEQIYNLLSTKNADLKEEVRRLQALLADAQGTNDEE